MKKELNKEKYEKKLTMFSDVLKEFYPEPWEVFVLRREKKKNIVENIVDFCVDVMPITLADVISEVSSYYLVKKDNLKLLVSIHDYIIEVIELPCNTKEKKFIYGKNIFINNGKINV